MTRDIATDELYDLRSRQPRPAVARANENQRRAPYVGARATILIVDDEPGVRQVLEEY